MKTRLLPLVFVPLLALAGCGDDPMPSTQSSGTDFPSQVAPEFDTKVENDLPPSDALVCDSRVVRTSEHDVALTRVANVNGEHTFYFAPQASTYNSYDFLIQFENGSFWVSEPSSGIHRAVVTEGSDQEEIPLALSSSFHTYGFTVPADVEQRLGAVRFYSAAVNGEHAGTCMNS